MICFKFSFLMSTIAVVFKMNREAEASSHHIEKSGRESPLCVTLKNMGEGLTLSVGLKNTWGGKSPLFIVLKTNRKASASPLHFKKGGEGFNPSCWAQKCAGRGITPFLFNSPGCPSCCCIEKNRGGVHPLPFPSKTCREGGSSPCHIEKVEGGVGIGLNNTWEGVTLQVYGELKYNEMVDQAKTWHA
jgi:hypothetical protein